ncbi:hypothetical protein PC41400_21615 [Paenibacillus chitinolyticus]|uniref:Major capsid protein n=1 Tax=Paenibacillus chitinolyticus TaxID=79263 RepID=A0A410X0I8_9BACL|nr:hypothetical protein [Paenibacillus chitinolyticus]MCY9593728.1 hypothetical protein [Paenibacillus chitinolyticus]MCY9599706.1 hypothetical protein [Paenibacillus chitinolyticus]QAV20120.1 hypothetical protein PC41400_21615 [Paenibacillus chitinolyticus]
MNRVGIARAVDISAAMQFQGPGTLITDDFQREITDALRRNSILDGRLNYTPATGDISTYYEQNTINGGQAVDPRNPTSTATSNPRTPHGLKVKAITNEVNFGHYDLKLGQQQNNFAELKAKDLNDMLNGIGLTHARMLWRGTDTNLVLPNTLEYVGLAKQITNTFTVSVTDSIITAIRAKVAAMIASEKYELMPTAIYMNPIAHHYLEVEVEQSGNSQTQISQLSKTTVAGIEVIAIMTAAGILPIIPEPFMPAEVNATDNKLTDYGIAIVTEPMIEYHYVGEKNMYLFQMGTTTNLREDYVGIKYGAPVAKGPSYAHAYGKVTRPTIAAVG